MDIIKVVVIADEQSSGFDIKSKISCENIAVVGYSELDELAVAKVLSLCPHMTILVAKDNSKVFDLSYEIYSKLPFCINMLITNEINISIMEQGMNSGIKKVVSCSLGAEELQQQIFSCFSKESIRRVNLDLDKEPCLSRVISFFGGKGGIGKTTIAVNTALDLAMEKKKVIIIDANLQMGDVHIHLDIEPKDTIGELIYEPNLSSIETIRSFITVHSSGLNILASPKSPEYAELVTSEQIELIINTLRPYYDYILIDLPPNFNDVSMSSFENSDKIIMIVGVDISSIRGGRISLSILENLRQDEKVSLVLNRVSKSIIGEKEIERVLNKKISFKVIEDSVIALKSLNKGNPIVSLYRKTPIANQLRKLSQSLR